MRRYLICAALLAASISRALWAQSMVDVSTGDPTTEWKVPCDAMPWPLVENRAFAEHESLYYKVSWGVVRAGRGRIEVQGMQPLDDRSAYRVSMTLETTGVTKHIHAYSEKTETWLDRATLLPLRYKKQTREGHYARNEDVHFEPACQRLNRTDERLDKDTVERKQAQLPGPTFDILGYVFYLRALPLKVGDHYDLTLAIGDHLYPVTAAVKARLKISTSAGWFECFYIEPSLRGGETTKKLRDLQLWLTADERKIPVRIRMGANFGHITAELASKQVSE